MDYVLENAVLRVTVTSAGAQIKSVRRKDDGAEHIWCGDASVWKFQTPVLFPYTGKLKGDRAEIRGKRVENAPMHGVVRLMEHTLSRWEGGSVTLTVESDGETMRVFPYRFRLDSTFRLEGRSLFHTLTVENRDTEAFRFGIGFHPGFAVPFDAGHTTEDYELRFSDEEAPICLETPGGLLNGRYTIPEGGMRTIAVREGMFDSGSRCMTGLRSETLGLYEKGSGRAVVCHIGGFPYCLLWSQPGRPRFVCIEPWHSLPDTEQTDGSWEKKAAAAVLLPAQRWSTTLETEFL